MGLEGGWGWIEVGMKDGGEKEIVGVGGEVGKVWKDYGGILMMEEEVEVVKEMGGDGVDVGKKEMGVGEGGGIVGEEYMIGGRGKRYEEVKKDWVEGVN